MLISLLKNVNVIVYRKNISQTNVKYGNNDPTIELNIATHFQSDANWKIHIHTVNEKACNRLNILLILNISFCCEALIQIYMSFIRSISEYCSKRNADLLEDVQITALSAWMIQELELTPTKLHVL